MFIRIEKGSAAPVSRQIVEQVRALCLSGALPAGASLPSVRQLARELAVNVNTIVRVYERLAAEGLVEMRHGDGTYVLPLPAAAETSRQLASQRAQFSREFDALVGRGLLLGFRLAELRGLLAAAAAPEKRRNAPADAPADATTPRRTSPS